MSESREADDVAATRRLARRIEMVEVLLLFALTSAGFVWRANPVIVTIWIAYFVFFFASRARRWAPRRWLARRFIVRH